MERNIKDIANNLSASTVREFWRNCALELLKAGYKPEKATKQADYIIRYYRGID